MFTGYLAVRNFLSCYFFAVRAIFGVLCVLACVCVGVCVCLLCCDLFILLFAALLSLYAFIVPQKPRTQAQHNKHTPRGPLFAVVSLAKQEIIKLNFSYYPAKRELKCH